MDNNLIGANEIHAAMGCRQHITFDQSMDALRRLGDALGKNSIWPELSGNEVHAFANAAVSAYLETQPQEAAHPDDEAADGLAALMKAKLAKQRAKGYGGWDDRLACPKERLSRLLREHVDKGDPVDVANFCAFLVARGEGIAPVAPSQDEPLLIGMKGSAYDLPNQKRAYTYKDQPGNVAASRIGGACSMAASDPSGDSIDRGLLLLKRLQAIGYGVFELSDPVPAQLQEGK